MTENINYVISLGKQCHTANFLKNNKLKNCSYPFDWIFSWYETNNYGVNHIILDCLKNNFELFMDKTYFEDNGKNLLEPSIYEYYKRCINRLYTILKKRNVNCLLYLT
jgi:hypothetical protein